MQPIEQTTHSGNTPLSKTTHHDIPRYLTSFPRPTAMSTDTGTASRTLLNLPGEIQNKIVGELEALDLLPLRATCRHYRNIIPPSNPTMHELVVIERSQTGMERDLYACRLRLHLRRSSHFADNMKKRDKRKGEVGTINRFCVDCGLEPPPKENGYSRGAHITRNGVALVKCVRCLRLATPAREGDKRYCTWCWENGTPEGQEMQRLRQAQRQLELQAQEQRRDQGRRVWGSDAEDTEEEEPGEDNWDFPYWEYERDINCLDWRDLDL
jgi:hypothetical protein